MAPRPRWHDDPERISRMDGARAEACRMAPPTRRGPRHTRHQWDLRRHPRSPRCVVGLRGSSQRGSYEQPRGKGPQAFRTLAQDFARNAKRPRRAVRRAHHDRHAHPAKTEPLRVPLPASRLRQPSLRKSTRVPAALSSVEPVNGYAGRGVAAFQSGTKDWRGWHTGTSDAPPYLKMPAYSAGRSVHETSPSVVLQAPSAMATPSNS